MSLRRLNKIALRFAQELFHHLKRPNIFAVHHQTENVLRKVGVQIGKQSRRFTLRKTIFRGFRVAARQRHPLLRPFATLQFHHQRLRELDQTRSKGLLVVLQQQPEKRDVFERVRHIFGTNIRYNEALAITTYPENLEGYDIGKYIAKGCNGAVYELKLMAQSGDEAKQRMGSINRYPLALKIMFNYEFKTPEHVLLKNMGLELVPLAPLPKALQGGVMANIRTLSRPHPNMIKMHTAFMDRFIILPGAGKLYPDALPTLRDYQGLREPRTLYVVMKRYRMTLHEYVGSRKRNYSVGKILFGQLLEAVVYLHQNCICHRDMKGDNVLLDYDNDEEVPHLVLSDFGSALATGSWTIPYHDDSVDLGGNMAIRAPEIRRARHGPNCVVDYEMADTWAAGTLAYEIFTRRNPFYMILSSQNYRESDLPPLPSRLVDPIKKIIGHSLRINPKERIKPEVAANVLLISLFRFGKDIREFFQKCGLHWYWSMDNKRTKFLKVTEKMESKIRDLTQLYASETILSHLVKPSVISSAELQLRATFLSRVDKNELHIALDYFLAQGNDERNSFLHDYHTFDDPIEATAFAYSSAED